jgi:zinc transport system substrate-binding protein
MIVINQFYPLKYHTKVVGSTFFMFYALWQASSYVNAQDGEEIEAHRQPALVVTTIKPLQHIAAAITAGVSIPALAPASAQDAHELSLRPSDRELMAKADIILWIGPTLELPLQSILQERSAGVITSQELPGLLLIQRNGKIDPHLWLHRGNALKIAQALTSKLSSIDPKFQANYAKNLSRFEQRLQNIEAAIKEAFAEHPVAAWGIDHNSLAYLQMEQGWPEALSLRSDDNNKPGLRSLMAFRQRLQESGLRCLLIEPYSDTSDLLNSLDVSALRLEHIDVLGLQREPGEDSYALFLQDLTNVIQRCARLLNSNADEQ